MFSKNYFGDDGIDHVHFKNNQRLFFREFKIAGGKSATFVILTSSNCNHDIGRVIDGKSIELKWILQELFPFFDTSVSLPRPVEEKILGKIDAIFNGNKTRNS
jgi:hypothetical protein